MKKRVLFLVLMAATITLQAQNIAGEWYGLTDNRGMQMRLIFHISQKADSLKVSLDSPDQKTFGLKVDKASYINNELSLKAQSLVLSYNGVANKSLDTITGTLEQEAEKFNLVLIRKKEENKVVRRPQDPKDFPYYREEVTFANSKANIMLSGTLTLPNDKKVSKIAILITGSGPQNRDEEVFNQRPFLVLSDWLTRQGIGVLRYDDRGIGKSTGQFSEATSLDFADDAESAIDYLLSRNDLQNISIGLIGHSEGGMIAPIVASRNKNVAFIVMLAGPGIPIDQLLIRQAEDIAVLEKVPENLIHLTVETFKKSLSYLKENSNINNEQAAEGLSKILKAEYEKYPKETEEGSKPDEKIKMEAKQLTGNWFRYFISYVPAQFLELVTCPVLAINGTLDCQVNYKSNLAAIQTALEKANNKKVDIVPLEGLNHVLQKTSTGAVSEYGQIDETINPVALSKVSSWITNLR